MSGEKVNLKISVETLEDLSRLPDEDYDEAMEKALDVVERINGIELGPGTLKTGTYKFTRGFLLIEASWEVYREVTLREESMALRKLQAMVRDLTKGVDIFPKAPAIEVE